MEEELGNACDSSHKSEKDFLSTPLQWEKAR